MMTLTSLTRILAGLGSLVRDQVLEAGRGTQARPANSARRALTSGSTLVLLLHLVLLLFFCRQLLARHPSSCDWARKWCLNQGRGREVKNKGPSEALEIQRRPGKARRRRGKIQESQQNKLVLAEQTAYIGRLLWIFPTDGAKPQNRPARARTDPRAIGWPSRIQREQLTSSQSSFFDGNKRQKLGLRRWQDKNRDGVVKRERELQSSATDFEAINTSARSTHSGSG